jgi:hypothetical protein
MHIDLRFKPVSRRTCRRENSRGLDAHLAREFLLLNKEDFDDSNTQSENEGCGD